MSLNNYAVNGTNLSTIFYHDTLRLNSNLTRYTGLSIGQRENDIYNNSVSVVPAETKYKINGVDICNNLFFQYVELTTVGANTITIPSWCTKISAILIGGGGGGGNGGFSSNYEYLNDRDQIVRVDDNGGGGGGGGSGYINNINNQSVTPGSTLNITIGDGGPGARGYLGIIDREPTYEMDGFDGDPSYIIYNSSIVLQVSGGNYGYGGGTPVVGGAGGANDNQGTAGTGGSNNGPAGSGGAGGITRFGNYFLSTSSVKTNNYGSGGPGGQGGDFRIREAGPGQKGKPGYARIYFMK